MSEGGDDVKRAVEWKIFEIQAGLISLEATEKYMELGIQWLLPRHYEEVIDERVSDGKCGYPLCHQGLQQTSKSIRKIYSSNSINQEILQNYCSINCCEKGQRYLESLDESSPYTRKAVKSLASSIKRQESEDIDAVLALICSDSTTSRSKSSEGNRQGNVTAPSNITNNNTNDTGFTSGSPRTGEQKWTEMPSSRMPPPTFNSVQSLYTPALLSYDPIQNVPPGHKPLGLSPRPSESKSQEESELSNGEHSTHLKFKSTKRDPGTRDSTIPAGPLIQNLPVPDLSQIDNEMPLVASRHMKKTLSFGRNDVRVFQRDSKSGEQYTESEWEEVKAQKVDSPKVVSAPSTDPESDDEDFPVYLQFTQPSFQTQVEEWLSDWGDSKSSIPTSESAEQTYTSTIKDDIQPCYVPPPPEKEIPWTEPKSQEMKVPPPSLSPEASKKAIKEAREKRKKVSSAAKPLAKPKDERDSTSKIMKPKVVERVFSETASPKVSSGDTIEGYSPIISRDQIRVSPQTSLSGLAIQPFQMKAEEDTDETRENDNRIVEEIERTLPSDEIVENDDEMREGEEMDSIVKQNFFLYMWTCLEDLFGYDAISWMNNLETQSSSEVFFEDYDEKKDMDPTSDDNIQSRQILNIPSLHHDSSILKHLNRGINHVEKILQIHSFLLKYYLKSTGTRASTSDNSTSSSSSVIAPPISTHDQMTNIYDLYLRHKKKLISFITIHESFNPSFNQRQWIFLSLLIIDALLCKKILIHDNISTSNSSLNLNEIITNWNNKFNAYAAGILGGANEANEVLNERQIINLRQFFTVESN